MVLFVLAYQTPTPNIVKQCSDDDDITPNWLSRSKGVQTVTNHIRAKKEDTEKEAEEDAEGAPRGVWRLHRNRQQHHTIQEGYHLLYKHRSTHRTL